MLTPRYWLTPPELEPERAGRFDPCPFPYDSLEGDWDGLSDPWEKPWYLNPPFSQCTRFVRKAIEEGGPGTLVFPITAPVALLLKAKIPFELLGRVKWIEVQTGRPMPNPPICAIARFPYTLGPPKVHEMEGEK